MQYSFFSRLWAEFLGTFALVFAGTAAIVSHQTQGQQVTHVGISLVFGLVVLALIYSFGDVSGAHFNPAVTIAFGAGKRFPWREVPGYLGAQLLGACLASFAVFILFPGAEGLGETVPANEWSQAFLMELLLTFLLMMVILQVSTGAKEKGVMAGVAIGGVVALEALLGGPVSGASMNPARSFGPALISGNWNHHWLYWVATITGALLAVPTCKLVRPSDCCDGGCKE